MKTPKPYSHRFCVAPMLKCTDRHDRYFLRLISKYAFLYSEMVTTGALLYGDSARFLAFSPQEHPIGFQLGGSDPKDLKACSKMVEDHGYDEVNLNIGCPSDRVQSAKIGACLMAEPEHVAECIHQMQTHLNIPVTIKTRIGIDDADDYEQLETLIRSVKQAGCKSFIIHARKAWLKGLNPKENRDIPPLNYDRVYQVKREHPDLNIIINGGIKELGKCKEHLKYVDGVMIGREAYHNPFKMLHQIDQKLYKGNQENPSRSQIFESYLSYAEEQIASGQKLSALARHIFGLFNGCEGARKWRRYLSEHMHDKNANIFTLRNAFELINHPIDEKTTLSHLQSENS